MLNVMPKLFLVAIVAAAISVQSVARPQSSRKNAGGQQAKIREIRSRLPANAEAPRECMTALREFMNYIFRDKPDMAEDAEAQKRWLTGSLREKLAYRLELSRQQQKQNPDDKIDFPSNSTFIGSWEHPTTYSIAGSRRYGERAVIDVHYEWGKGTNYPGDTRLVSYVFLLEDGSWKLDDVYTFRGEFIHAHSLSEELGEAAH